MTQYKNTKVKVRSPDWDVDYIDIVADVLQGDTVAPHLFIFCLDYILRTSKDLMKENSFTLAKNRQKIPAQTITDVDYTDDITLLSNSPAQDESLLHNMAWAVSGIGLHVNADKTEYTWFEQRSDISTLNGSPLKLVNKFTNQGSNVSSIEKNINMWLAKAWTANDSL